MYDSYALNLLTMSEPIDKVILATVVAGTVGGVGGHSIGSSYDITTPVDYATIESCHSFIEHTKQHARTECDLEKLQIKLPLRE